MHSLTRGEDQRGRAAVDRVSRGHDPTTRLERALQQPTSGALGTQDAEDRPDGDVDVDVARAIERVEANDVLSGLAEHPGLLELFAGDHRAPAAPLEHRAEDVVGEGVELLHLFPLDVRLAGVSKQPGEPGRSDTRVNDPEAEGDGVEDR